MGRKEKVRGIMKKLSNALVHRLNFCACKFVHCVISKLPVAISQAARIILTPRNDLWGPSLYDSYRQNKVDARRRLKWRNEGTLRWNAALARRRWSCCDPTTGRSQCSYPNPATSRLMQSPRVIAISRRDSDLDTKTFDAIATRDWFRKDEEWFYRHVCDVAMTKSSTNIRTRRTMMYPMIYDHEVTIWLRSSNVSRWCEEQRADTMGTTMPCRQPFRWSILRPRARTRHFVHGTVGNI